ncbi:MAG: hypothetical protein H0V07_10870, partial [Propionibacteriales bacterium]|nr:hypothetical protein [Propionibacteriales bacterium]
MFKPAWHVAGTIFGAAAVIGSVAVVRSGDSASPAHRPVPSESQIRDLDIQFYQQRVVRDQFSARDFTQLAGLYLQRARETADNADLVRAEENARHSLSLRVGRNEAALGILASSLLSQHRFVEARHAARRLVAYDSTSIAARGLLAETEFELGRYAAAGRM